MADAIVLPTDRDDTGPDPLEGLEGDLRGATAWRSGRNLVRRDHRLPSDGAPDRSDVSSPPSVGGAAQSPLPVRQLKQIEDLAIGELSVISGSKALPSRRRQVAAGGLSDPPPVESGVVQHKAAEALPRAYTDVERETLAVDVLRQVLETDKRALRDLRRVANLGADVVDNLGKYFEIKASAGDMPDVVSLQYSQIARSLEQKPGDWFLVVIAGLENGYETKIRFIADPLRHLSWADTGSMQFAGVRAAKAIEIALPERAADPDGSSSESK